MIEISLNNGDAIKVTLQDNDGEFQIHYDTARYPQQLVIREYAGLPGNVKGGALEILYQEDFRNAPANIDELVGEADEDEATPVGAQHHGWFCDARGDVHHTDTIHCVVREYASGGLVVVTLDSEDNETGEFTFYQNLQELDAQTGVTRALKVLP